MSKVGLVMSLLMSMLGFVLLSAGLLVHALMPKFGLMIFMISEGGSFSPRMFAADPALIAHHVIATACILLGMRLARDFWMQGREDGVP